MGNYNDRATIYMVIPSSRPASVTVFSSSRPAPVMVFSDRTAPVMVL